MIPTLLVTSHTDLELHGFDVNYVPAISKYSITCISSMKKTVVVGLTLNVEHLNFELLLPIQEKTAHSIERVSIT